MFEAMIGGTIILVGFCVIGMLFNSAGHSIKWVQWKATGGKKKHGRFVC